MSKQVILCPICGDKKFESIPKLKSHYIVKCMSCGFVFSNRIPWQSELDDVYKNYNYESTTETAETLSKREDIARKLISIKPTLNVLDVGCGNGAWLDAFRKFRCKTFGTEYNEHQMRVAKSKGHIILEGGLFPQTHSGDKFDLIIFTEVIEHILNPLPVLNHLNSLLIDGGHIFITTPNFAAIERVALGEKWDMICYPEHLGYFTPKTLHLGLKNTGFTKVEMYTENISILGVLQAIGAKKNSSEKVSDSLQSLSKRNAFFTLFKMITNKFLDFLGVGVSIVAIYKKPNAQQS
jgi:SAM-dependent methyltransferase